MNLIRLKGATMLRKTASYINRHHLALFALFFALGGTSFAAGYALVPGTASARNK